MIIGLENPILGLFEIGCFRQVLLYIGNMKNMHGKTDQNVLERVRVCPYRIKNFFCKLEKQNPWFHFLIKRLSLITLVSGVW